jgi:hypothetical protein
MTNERRTLSRSRTYLEARIAYNHRFSTMDCFVRNLTQSGAKIVFSDLASIPGEFDISIGWQGESRRARVVWRTKSEAGIQFSNSLSQAVVSIESARKIRKLETERDELSRRVAQLSEPA